MLSGCYADGRNYGNWVSARKACHGWANTQTGGRTKPWRVCRDSEAYKRGVFGIMIHEKFYGYFEAKEDGSEPWAKTELKKKFYYK